jgi:hypothetical protein
MICKAHRKKKKGQCTRKAEYGVLCHTHAKQFATCPEGFHLSRIKRAHFFEINEDDMEDAKYEFERTFGIVSYDGGHPLGYRHVVVDYLKEWNEATSSQLVAAVKENSRFKMGSGKVGQLLRAMLNDGTLMRRDTSVNGRGVALYALYGVKGELWHKGK